MGLPLLAGELVLCEVSWRCQSLGLGYNTGRSSCAGFAQPCDVLMRCFAQRLYRLLFSGLLLITVAVGCRD